MNKYIILIIALAFLYFGKKESMPKGIGQGYGSGFGNRKGLLKSGTFTDLKKNAQQVYMTAAQQRVDQEEIDAMKVQGADASRRRMEFLETGQGIEDYCRRSCAHLDTFKANHEKCMRECFKKRISINPF